MSWSQQDLSFKKLSNKRVTTSTGKGLPEEKGASALELYLPDIKTELIPGTGNTATGLNGVLYYYGPSASFGQTLVVDTSVPGNLTWFASSGYGNTTTANDGSAGSEALRLSNWVSDKYDAFGTVSGAGYEIKLFDNAGNLITKSDASNWLFDYQTGILLFNNATLSNGNPVSTSGPYRIVGWRYVGQKGTIPAYFGGSGYTTYTKGDILVGAGGTFIKLNVGSDNYVLSADSSTSSGLKWVVNSGSGSGSGISFLNNLTAGVQYFAVGTSGSLFNISSIGSTHTFNIPIAGSGATGLVSTDSQTFAGQKTFTSAIIGDLTGTATTAGFATTANYSNQSGYAITSGLATTATYAHQSGYAITAGLATTATYAHQSGYASTAGIANSSYSSFINSSNSNLSHPLIFAPIAGSSSGAGLSLNTVLNYNPSSNILYTSGLAITATTASSSTSNGALQVAGGVGISGRLFFNQASFGTTGISSNPTIAMIGTTGDPIYLSVLEDNTISFEGSQGQLFSITPNLSTGYIYSVNDITGIPLIRANANANVTANEYAGNFGIGATNPGYKLHVIGSVGFTSVIASTSTSTGTLVVSGGVGIGGSLNVNSASSISNVIINNGIIYGNLTGTATTAGFATTAGLATTATYAHQAGYAITSGSSSTATTATYAHQSGYAITSGSSDTSGLATTATYAHQSGYAITSGLATTATYSHQSGYAITSGSSALATTATYAHQSGYAITSGLATTATYAHQSGYATTSGSSSTATTATIAQGVLSSITGQAIDLNIGLISGTALSYSSNLYYNPASGRLAAVSYTGSWAGSLITGLYGGTGYTAYTKGDILVGAGGTFIKLGVGSDNTVLTASSSSATGLTWSPTANTGITTLNTLTAATQFFSTGTSGSAFNISSSGSTHTFNIPIAGTGATGLVSTLAQTFAGAKTFTGDVVITSSTASIYMASGALTVNGGVGISGQLSVNQVAMGYTGIATNPVMSFIGSTNAAPITMTVLSDGSLLYEGSSGKLFGINNNLSSGWIFNVGDISGLPIIRANADGTIAMAEFAANVGIGLSNPSYKLHVAGDTNLSSTYVYRINGTSVLSSTQVLGLTVNSGNITSGTWSGTAISVPSGGTGLTTYTVGDILYASGSATIGRLTAGTAGSILISAGAGATPYYSNPALLVSGNATTAANINIVATATGTLYPLFTNIPTTASGIAVSVDSGISYDAATDTLTAGKFSGLASGTAATFTNIYGTLSGFATTATNVNSVSTTATNATHYLMFSPVNGGSGVALSSGVGVTFNPSSGQLGLGTGSALINGLLLGSSSNTITTTSGNLTLNASGGTVLIGGNLNVQGTATYIDSTTQTITDPVIVLGSGAGGTHTNVVDTQDRGIEFRRFSGSAITGFFGVSNASGRFTFIPNANVTANNTYTGSIGVIEANITGSAITATNFYGTFVGNSASATTAGLATTAQNLNITTTATGTLYPLFTSVSTTASGVAVSVDGTDIYYDAATNTLTAGKFSGLASGTAATFTNLYGTLTGTATTAQNLNVVSSTTGTFYPLFTNVSSSASGVAVSVDSGISWDSATDTLTAGKFSGLASGSAATYTNFYGTLTGNVTGTSTTSQNVNIVSATSGTFYPLFSNVSSTASGVAISVDSGLSWNAATDTLTSGTFSGNLSATAATATNFYGTFVGNATTALNINIVAANSNSAHQLVFTPTSGSGSGVAVSSRTTLNFNPSTDILSVSGLAVTATTASTNSSTGALIVSGGVGIGGTIYTATDLNVGNSTTGRLYFSQATLGSAGTTVIPSMAFIGTTNSPITLSVLADNSLSFDGSSGQLFSINNNLSTGWIFAVNDISGLPLIRANADGTVAMGEFAGNIGIGISNPSYKLHVVGDTNLSSTYVYRINGTSVLSASSLGTGVTNSSLTAVGTITTGTWAGSTITGLYGGTGYTNYTAGDILVGAGGTFIRLNAGSSNYVLTSNGSGTIPSWQAVPSSAASSVAVSPTITNSSFSITAVNSASGSGLGLSTIASFVVNPSTGIVSMSGLAVTASTTSTSSSTGALIVTGGVGIGGSLFTSTSFADSISGVVLSNGVITSGSWSGSTITAFYGGTGYNSYTKGDILVGAGSTFIKLNVGTDNYVLTANSSSATGLTWSPTSATGITSLNSLTATQQYFSTGTSGSGFNISSTGSTHTFNIPIAGSGVTGLITGIAQTIAGQKTFTSAIIGDLTGTATTAGFATTANYAYQSGYGLTSGFATTTANLNVSNASTGIFHPVLSNTASSTSGIGASVNSFFSFNAATGAFGATSVNILAGQSYSIGGNSVLSATSLGIGVTNSSLTALGTITTGTWAGSTITGLYGGTGYNSYNSGDILVGAGSTFIKVGLGSTNYILSANSSLYPAGVGWTWVSAVGVGTNPPVNEHDSDLWWNSNDGSLNFYYNDGDTSQWVEIAGGSGIDLSQPVHITSGTASTNTITGALIVDGGVGVGGTVYASSFSINGVYDQISSTLTTSNTNTNQVALSIDASSFRTAKMFVQVTSGSNYHSQEILMVHDDSQVYMTEYAMVNTGAIGSTFDGDISGGNMRFLVTPTNAVTTYKIACSVMRI